MGTTEYKTDLVEKAYLTYLHRAADPTSLSAYVTSLMQGSNNDLVLSSLLGSGEYASQNATT